MTDEEYRSPYAERDYLSLPTDVRIYRAVLPIEIDWCDGWAGGPGLASRALQDTTVERAQELGYPAPAMSVDFVSALEADGLSALDLIDAHFDRGHGLVTLTVAGIRQVNPPLGIAADPLAGRQSHALVFAYTRERFSGSQKKQLKKSVVEWAFVPEQKRLQ